ncbi:MAG: hypothetical protein EWM45_06620 [Rhodopseudomonas palustris]|nr:MAG: hypothetical protein EWM45_06620 [Rhodopseudomonas palustris]
MSALTRTAPRPARNTEQNASAFAYHGRRYLGAIHPRGDQFEAVTSKGMNIGRFNSQRAAWHALAEKQGE